MAKLPLPISVSILYAPTNASFIRDEAGLELWGNAMLDGRWYLAGYELDLKHSSPTTMTKAIEFSR